jgi:hypothetical protein
MSATPALPQGVEEWIKQNKFSALSAGEFNEVVSIRDLRDYLSGMAIVPVELLKEAVGQLSELNTFAAIRAIIEDKP